MASPHPRPPWPADEGRVLMPIPLLNVGDLSVCKDHFHVGVEIHLLGAEVDDLLRLAEDFKDLVRSLAQGDGLRRRGWLRGGLLRWRGIVRRRGLLCIGLRDDYFLDGLHDFVGGRYDVFRKWKFQLAVVTHVVVRITVKRENNAVRIQVVFRNPKLFTRDELALRNIVGLLIGRAELHIPGHHGAEAEGDCAALVGVGGRSDRFGDGHRQAVFVEIEDGAGCRDIRAVRGHLGALELCREALLNFGALILTVQRGRHARQCQSKRKNRGPIKCSAHRLPPEELQRDFQFEVRTDRRINYTCRRSCAIPSCFSWMARRRRGAGFVVTQSGSRVPSTPLLSDKSFHGEDRRLCRENLLGGDAVNFGKGVEAGVLQDDAAVIQVSSAPQRGKSDAAGGNSEEHQIVNAARTQNQVQLVFGERSNSLLVDDEVFGPRNGGVKSGGGSAGDEEIVFLQPLPARLRIRKFGMAWRKPESDVDDQKLFLARIIHGFSRVGNDRVGCGDKPQNSILHIESQQRCLFWIEFHGPSFPVFSISLKITARPPRRFTRRLRRRKGLVRLCALPSRRESSFTTVARACNNSRTEGRRHVHAQQDSYPFVFPRFARRDSLFADRHSGVCFGRRQARETRANRDLCDEYDTCVNRDTRAKYDVCAKHDAAGPREESVHQRRH